MTELSKPIVISTDIENKFRFFMESGRIILFEAPCGFGKTTVAKTLLEKTSEKVAELRADEANFSLLADDDSWDILFLEDLHLLQSNEEYQNLCAIIRSNPTKRFVFTSRGAISGELIPFRISGLLIEISEDDMFFDKQLTAEYFNARKIKISETELNSVMKVTWGYPLAVEMIAEKMCCGAVYNQKIVDEIRQDIFKYYDEMIFCRFDLPIRRFLLELAPFTKFNTELAKMVSGDAQAGKIIAYLQKRSRMLKIGSDDMFFFWPVFRNFLLWEQDMYYTEEQQRALFSRGGLYYELHSDYVNALEFYSKSKEQNKVSELIIKITSLHPGMGYYEELENYYLSLPDDVIAASPSLMQGKSMLCSLYADYEGSEAWYNKLREFAEVRKYSDAAAKEARSRLAWLDISLPQRGVTGLIDAIGKTFRLIVNKDIKMMSFSVTSTLPSIMNGGKDFSQWSKKDDILYATMRIPVEGVLGKDGVGLADCAIAESKFEKGENISNKMLSLVSKLNEIQNKGTPDIEFAVVGLLVRNQIDAGRAEDARHTLEALKERFTENGYTRFAPNIDAMMCRIELRLNNIYYVDEWYRDKAPRNSLKIKVMKRYQYFTEAMTELSFGDAEGALLTLYPLEPYCQKCERHIDMIHLKTICAIAKFRKKDNSWENDILSAVKIAEEYGFVRTIGMYGAAVLPLLSKISGKKSSDFLKKVIKSARCNAVYYPDFLKPQSSSFEKLTEAEMQVLRLLCADKSNQEIGKILNISIATVKSHVSHILQKLGVKRRNEAKTTAERLHII